jgi:small ligand-binding sensory domain FIST
MRFAHAHADGADAREVADRLLAGLRATETEHGPARLGFLYFTDVLADDVQDLLVLLRDNTGVTDWVGCAGMGVAATGAEYFDRPAAVAMIAELPAGGYRLLPPTAHAGPVEVPADMAAWLRRLSPPFAVIHADPATDGLAGKIEGLSREVADFIVGGLVCARESPVQIAGQVGAGGLSGAVFAPEVEVATGLTQGCSPLGEAHTVSKAEGNVVMALDGEPALDVFKRDIGELLARDLGRVAGYIHAAFPIAGSDTGDYTVRGLMGIDEGRGWLAIGGSVEPGNRLLFVRRDPKSAEKDLERMLARLTERLPGPPKGGLYISCVARGPGMFGAEGREMQIVRNVLGDVPLVGFYANGEISHDRLYGYTGVCALFL